MQLLQSVKTALKEYKVLDNIGYICFIWERTTDWWQFVVPISLNKHVSLGFYSAACHVQRRISKEYFPKRPNKFYWIQQQLFMYFN